MSGNDWKSWNAGDRDLLDLFLWSVSLSLLHTWCKRAWDSTNQCQFDESVWKLVIKGTMYRKKMEQGYLSILNFEIQFTCQESSHLCFLLWCLPWLEISDFIFLSCRNWIPRRWMAISVEVQHSHGCWEISPTQTASKSKNKVFLVFIYFYILPRDIIHVYPCRFWSFGHDFLKNQLALRQYWWALPGGSEARTHREWVSQSSWSSVCQRTNRGGT